MGTERRNKIRTQNGTVKFETWEENLYRDFNTTELNRTLRTRLKSVPGLDGIKY